MILQVRRREIESNLQQNRLYRATSKRKVQKVQPSMHCGTNGSQRRLPNHFSESLSLYSLILIYSSITIAFQRSLKPGPDNIRNRKTCSEVMQAERGCAARAAKEEVRKHLQVKPAAASPEATSEANAGPLSYLFGFD